MHIARPAGEGQAAADWHSLEAGHVQEALETSAHGLSQEVAARRLRQFGPNQLRESPPTSSIVILARQLRSPVIYILLAGDLTTLVLREYIDAAVIGVAISLNALIGFIQERRAENAVRALMQLLTPKARVIRGGHEWEIDSSRLVPGDVVFLESGSRVPADLRLFSVTALAVDESLLTGESATVTKAIEPVEQLAEVAARTSMVYAGTIVTSGRGRGFVVATGQNTQLGAIAEEVRAEERVATPMQDRTGSFARFIGVAVLVTAALAFAIGLAVGENSSDMLLTAVALAVSAIPEGLPAASTITLAIGVRRMARRNAVIRRLAAAETLGSTTVIGSDKTGTLTENRMTVMELWAGGRAYAPRVHTPLQPDGDLMATGADQALADPLYLTLLCGVMTNEAEVYEQDDRYEFTGDPTEAALLVAAEQAGIDTEEVRGEYRAYAEIPFEPERQFSASFRELDRQRYVFVKGAPERLLSMCQRMAGPSGEEELDASLVRAAASRMAEKSLRVLGMAYRQLDQSFDDSGGMLALEALTFLGIQGMMDPPREGVAEAIAGCRSAGMRVLMITGDHPDTARAIGRELGIIGDSRVVTGHDLENMEEAELQETVGGVSIYARVSPQDKLRIVRALQSRGEVVAVTGDGVNDAPALKAADIGIAMGRSGTDVARQAADMVLADDNFVSIYAAVEEGRVIFDNVRKVTFFLVSTGAAEIFLIISSLLLRWPLPLIPAQILWLNVVTNGLQDIALAFEPKEPGILNRPPHSKREGLISRLLWERIAVTGSVMGLATLLLFRWQLDDTGSLERAQTMALTTMVVFQTFHIGNSRSEYLSAFKKSPISNPFLFISAATALAVHVAALYLSPTQYILRVEPIGIREWAIIVLVASTIIGAVELHKLVRGTTTGTGKPPPGNGRVPKPALI